MVKFSTWMHTVWKLLVRKPMDWDGAMHASVLNHITRLILLMRLRKGEDGSTVSSNNQPARTIHMFPAVGLHPPCLRIAYQQLYPPTFALHTLATSVDSSDRRYASSNLCTGLSHILLTCVLPVGVHILRYSKPFFYLCLPQFWSWFVGVALSCRT